MTVLGHVFQKLLKMTFGGVWKGLKRVAREALKCCELNLMGDSSQSLEDQNVHRSVNKNADDKDHTQISVGNKDFIGNWAQDHVCYTLAENLFIFCSYSQTLWKKIKG